MGVHYSDKYLFWLSVILQFLVLLLFTDRPATALIYAVIPFSYFLKCILYLKLRYLTCLSDIKTIIIIDK